MWILDELKAKMDEEETEEEG